MTDTVRRTRDGFEVDAVDIAQGLGLRPENVPTLMRQGQITSRVEQGAGEDEGRVRLTFFHRGARFTVIADGSGRILRRSTLTLPETAPPRALRRR